MNKKTLKLSKREMASAFRNAANALDKYGWRSGAMGSKSTKFCAMGALNHILGFEFGPKYTNNFTDVHPSLNGLLSKLCGQLRTTCSVEDIIIGFNDGQPLHKGKVAVQKFFRTLARGLEHGGVL